MAKSNGRRNGNGNGSSTNGTIELLPNDLKSTPTQNNSFGRRIKIKCKNESQKEFIKLIDQNEITLCNGMAGSGKSFLSLIKALDYIQKPDNPYKSLYIMTPAVELEEKLGAMPGTLLEKLHPFLFSSYYLIDKIIGKEAREKMVADQVIQPLALSFLTGVNIDDGILIFEEAQNSSVKQMKRLLTRIGYGAKFIISGDLQQVDRFKKIEDSGLHYAMNHLQGINGVGIYDFPPYSSVRNPIINEIIEKYD